MLERFIYKRFCLNEMYANNCAHVRHSVIAGIYTVAGATMGSYEPIFIQPILKYGYSM